MLELPLRLPSGLLSRRHSSRSLHSLAVSVERALPHFGETLMLGLMLARAMFLLLLVFPLNVFAHAGPHKDLPNGVRKVLSAHGLPESSLSLWVQDVTAAQPLLTLHEDVARNPASVMKTVTTLVALHQLTPGYEWETSAFATAPVRAGRLKGDLYLRGGGDPFLVVERFWKLVHDLRATGLRQIDGDLVLDSTNFDLPVIDPGEFDGKAHRAYNVPPHALLVNFGVTRFTLRPNRTTGMVDVQVDPPLAGMQTINNLKLTGGKCRGQHYRVGFQVLDQSPTPRVRFSGNYPRSCGLFSFQRAVASPEAYIFGLFKSLWESAGGSLVGTMRSAVVPPSAVRLHAMPSRPLGDLVRSMNKHSNNVMTRNLFLTLGAARLGYPGTLEKGRIAVQEWFAANEISTPHLFIDNGAGLSRDARISAKTLGRLLLRAYAHPYMPEFIASLPISAVDGTLRTRFVGSPLAGRMHVKTGLLNHVRAMAGYVVTGAGRTLAVVSLQNHKGVHTKVGTNVQNAVFRWVFAQ